MTNISSCSIQVAVNCNISFSWTAYYILVYYIVYYIISLYIILVYYIVNTHLPLNIGYFHILIIILNIVVNLGRYLCKYFKVILLYLEMKSRGVHKESYESSAFLFLRNFPTVWQRKPDISPNSRNYFFPRTTSSFYFLFFNICTITGVRCYFIVILICISLIISNSEKFFMLVGHLKFLFLSTTEFWRIYFWLDIFDCSALGDM